ncbi:MAG: response regulator [Sulfuricurvum sp.]
MKAKILIVEDESIIALNIKEILNSQGYEVIGIAPDGAKAFELLERKTPDLILMDITLKNREDGIDVAERITRQLDRPIVFLTANDKEKTIDRAIGIRPYGYVLKPFKEAELKTAVEIALKSFERNRKLLNRIDTITSEYSTLQNCLSLEQHAKSRFVALKHGYVFDNDETSLMLAGEEIILNDKEKKFLKLLVKYLGKTVSVEQIEDYVWNGELVGEGALRSLIFRIRQKLPKDLITCYSKIGYKLNVES